jgi:hypothetical protein
LSTQYYSLVLTTPDGTERLKKFYPADTASVNLQGLDPKADYILQLSAHTSWGSILWTAKTPAFRTEPGKQKSLTIEPKPAPLITNLRSGAMVERGRLTLQVYQSGGVDAEITYRQAGLPESPLSILSQNPIVTSINSAATPSTIQAQEWQNLLVEEPSEGSWILRIRSRAHNTDNEIALTVYNSEVAYGLTLAALPIETNNTWQAWVGAPQWWPYFGDGMPQTPWIVLKKE